MTILLFRGVRSVISAEKLLNLDGYNIIVRPVPTSISSECGMCIEIDSRQKNEIVDFLNKKKIDFQINEVK